MSDEYQRVAERFNAMETREFVNHIRKVTREYRRSSTVGVFLELALNQLELEANVPECPGCGKFGCTCY